jgi:hypothetical protein
VLVACEDGAVRDAERLVGFGPPWVAGGAVLERMRGSWQGLERLGDAQILVAGARRIFEQPLDVLGERRKARVASARSSDLDARSANRGPGGQSRRLFTHGTLARLSDQTSLLSPPEVM